MTGDFMNIRVPDDAETVYEDFYLKIMVHKRKGSTDVYLWCKSNNDIYLIENPAHIFTKLGEL